MPKRSLEHYIPSPDELQELQLNSKATHFVTPVKAKIQKVGSSTGVTIPPVLLEHLGLEVGDMVYLYVIKRED